ncbi:MAG: DUF4139 domain-containing protein [Acidobacteria bacterium]|nr:DUF4139 domain-containing protein [Acidobacteriota bacterium]
MTPKLLLCLLLTISVAQGAELPIRQVILYKHGIGYFQRSGQLGPNDSVQLDFNAAEMNDVLKSLTIQESGAGKVTGLRYDSSDPLDKKLAEFPFKIGPGQPLTAILDQLKGAVVELKSGAETIRGTLVSGRTVPGTEQRPPSEQITLLLDSGEFRNVDLSAVASLRFQDTALQTQFAEYLKTLHTARSRDKRSVYIDSTGAQAREIAASYMIPMPVWKSSYRLIFGTAGEPTLEGWAIVDNTTGDDWSNVQLSLVSGRPISFISRLYEPRYITRPTAELPEDQAKAPVVYGGAIEEKDEEAQVAGAMGGVQPKAFPLASELMAADRPLNARQFVAGVMPAAPSAVAMAATGGELGELFEYSFSTPVTVRKSESAMLPFLQEKLTARKLLIYSDPSSVNPLNSVELTNSTEKTLDGGPITVYDANAYAGEALVETLKKGDKRLISYGVDLGTRITTAFESQAQIVREAHFQRGLLSTKTAASETKTFTIRNVDQQAKTLIIEHPLRQSYKVLNQKPIETTATSYRFEVKLGPDATEKFPVTEERILEATMALTNLTPDVIATYVQNKNISDAARAQLQQVLDLKRQIASNDGEIARTQTQINTIVQDQERIRQNINSLNRVAGQEQQVQTYSRQLATQEAQLATLRDKLSQLQTRKTTLESQLNALLEKMEF